MILQNLNYLDRNSGFRYKLIRACSEHVLVRNTAYCVGVRTFGSGIIARKFSPAGIKIAAWKALKTAAAWVGTTGEGLLDRTLPDLGFDERARRCFDYGKRKDTVTITANLAIEVFDEKGKKLKNLSVPEKQDDEEKAAAAYEEFRQLKKLLKTVAAFQKMRLETALSDGRAWSMKAWKRHIHWMRAVPTRKRAG